VFDATYANISDMIILDGQVVEMKVNLHCDECIRKILKAIKKIEGNSCMIHLLESSVKTEL